MKTDLRFKLKILVFLEILAVLVCGISMWYYAYCM